MFTCVYCRSNRLTKYNVVNGYIINKCNKCELLITQVSEAQRKTELIKQYDVRYVQSYKKSLQKFYKRYEMHASLIKKYVLSGSLLDIGCGTGYFLQFLKKRYSKLKIYGVEPNRILRKIASQNTGEVVRNGTLSTLPFDNEYFDIVTCWDVLEHDFQLKTNIREIRRVIKSDGYLLIQAPNYQSAMAYITGVKWDWWSPPDHVLHFSSQTLAKILKDNGFRIVYKRTYEDQVDFLSNIKGVLFKPRYMKILFYLLAPIFVLNEKIATLLGYGGLILIVAKKI